MTLTPIIVTIRYYSIASSPDYTQIASAGGGNVILDIILTVLEYKTEGMQGLKRKGFCSNYLADANVGSNILLFLKQSNFHLPTSLTHRPPILLIGAGAGMAPFRGFWQDLLLNSINKSKRIEVVQQLEMLDFNDTEGHDTASDAVDKFSDFSNEKAVSLFFGCRNKNS